MLQPRNYSQFFCLYRNKVRISTNKFLYNRITWALIKIHSVGYSLGTVTECSKKGHSWNCMTRKLPFLFIT